MGATGSIPVSEEISPVDNSTPTYILKLYSREFERDEGPVEDENLYLDGYGEDEVDEVPVVESTPVDTPSSADDDDDYPIETMRANLETKPATSETSPHTLTHEEPEPVEDIHASFEAARASRQSELDNKYPSLSSRGSSCESERGSLMQCYKENADVLNCREAVTAYGRCAQSATSELLKK
jgi:hypothetical protein